MGPEDNSRNGKRKVRERVGLMAQDDLYLRHLGLSPSEYGETQLSARKTGVTSLNVRGRGANLGVSLIWNLGCRSVWPGLNPPGLDPSGFPKLPRGEFSLDALGLVGYSVYGPLTNRAPNQSSQKPWRNESRDKSILILGKLDMVRCWQVPIGSQVCAKFGPLICGNRGSQPC
jgi:hypothetical protein